MVKKKVTMTLDVETIAELKELSDTTLIPQARIVERAILNEMKRMKESNEPLSLTSDND